MDTPFLPQRRRTSVPYVGNPAPGPGLGGGSGHGTQGPGLGSSAHGPGLGSSTHGPGLDEENPTHVVSTVSSVNSSQQNSNNDLVGMNHGLGHGNIGNSSLMSMSSASMGGRIRSMDEEDDEDEREG